MRVCRRGAFHRFTTAHGEQEEIELSSRAIVRACSQRGQRHYIQPMYLIQILLPLFDNQGAHFEPALYADTRRELTDRFGGLTAFSRAPAEGLWQDDGKTKHDDIIVLEVMADGVDTDWWRAYRRTLETRFKQDVIVVRAQMVSLL